MTLPPKPNDEMPADFGYWTAPDLGRGPVVARTACLRALLTLVKDWDVTAPLTRVDGLVKTIKSLPDDWKRGFPPAAVTHDPIVQRALKALAVDPTWQEYIAVFIRRGRYGEALGRAQVLDLRPILLPRRETPVERSERLQRITMAFQGRFPVQETVVARIVDWATRSLCETPQARTRVVPEGSEWVLESGPIYESTECLDDLTVRLAYPQEDFPDRLATVERLQFLYEMHGRIAEELERADGRNLCELAGNHWQMMEAGEEKYRPFLTSISPAVPADYYFADLACFGKRRQGLAKRIAFLRAIREFRGEPLTEEEILKIQFECFAYIPDLASFKGDKEKFYSMMLDSLTLDIFSRQGGDEDCDEDSRKTGKKKSLAEMA